MDGKFITIKEAAKLLGVSTLTLRNWDKSGKFKALRHPINNYRVYRTDAIEKLLGEMRVVSYSKTGKRVRKLEIRHLD